MLNQLRTIAVIAALIAAVVLLGEAVYTIHITRPKVIETLSKLHDTAADVRDLVRFESDELQSEAYQKRIKQSFEVGRDVSLTVAKFNRTVIPELTGLLQDVRTRNLVSLDQTTRESTDLLRRLGVLVTDTNGSLNSSSGLLASLVSLSTKLGASVDELTAAVKQISEQSGLAITEVNRRLADPRIDQLMDELTATGKNITLTTAHVEEGFRNFPVLTTEWTKYAKAATVWQRRIYLVRFLSILAGIPGLL